MKPIRLTLQNFGPYAGEPVVVDFQELDPVFLICGDTGAGKTSLFDGMCYALYGEPLGTRSDKSLRSNVAREGESTLAEFEFEVRGTRYLARRSPNWFTPKLRGGGFRSEEIHLLLAKGEVLAARTRDMTERVEAILGLTHGEFAKILVLPQGEFQRFLEMNTADREGILQKLFPIQEHKRLTDLAKARAEQSRRTLQGIQSQLKEAAGEAALDEAQGEARALELEERLRTSVQDEAEALKLRDAALERLREGRSLAQAFAEQDRLRQDEAAFQAARTQRDALDQEFQLARRAAACEGQVTRLADTQTALDQAQAEQSSTRNQLGEAKARRGSLQPALDALPERQRRLEALKGQDALGGKQLDDLTEIGKAWRASQEAARKLAGAEAVLATRDQEAAAAKQCIEALDAVEAERGLLQARLDGLAPLKGKMDRLQGDAGTVRAWPELERQLEAEVASGAMAASAAAATLRDEEARVERLRLHRESNLAAALAASLGEGDPCPVCGSSHHPRLARPAAESDPASWTLEPPRVGAAFRTAAQTAQEEHARSGQALALARAAFEAASGRLGEAGWTGAGAFDAARDELERQERALRAEIKQRVDQLAGRGRWVQQRETAATALDAARQARDLARDASTTAQAQRDTLQTSLGLVIEDPEQAYRDARRVQDDRRREIQRTERELQELASRREAADQAILGCAQTLSSLAELVGKALETRRKAADSLLEALARQEFGTPEAQAEARRGPERMAEIERRRQQDAAEETRRSALLEDLARRLDGQSRPDLERLGALAAAANAGFAAAAAARQESASALQAFQERRLRVQELVREMERLTQENANLHRLAEELEGNNSRRLRFSSWALAWWLDRVLEQSTHRLETLSGGRYRFKLRSEINDGRRAAGLEIDVYDAYANGTRGVRSLSGGEKFLASLALALGLAEVIQSRGGGIELDAIFIDEGFGSLDGETLEQAMAVLDERGQGRMVGLISHVEGMKQDIPCQIRVRRHAGGSRIETIRAARKGIIMHGETPWS